jgi:cysteinyl-tRNA synthetase
MIESPMEIRIYNSLTRRTEQFEPQDAKSVSMYICGPTVYNYAHIGNARPPVLFGLFARLLKRHFGADHVRYARNITDVDDNINAAAKKLEAPGLDINGKIARITERFTQAYHQDMDALGAERPDLEPRATGHIETIVAMCRDLIESGHAYEAEGHVLFNVESFPEYGRLSGRSVKEMIAGARVEIAPFKKHPADFVLWKPSEHDLPGWASPFGRGRPGWHIECSAMNKAIFGTTIDLHCGGNDLTFPHHENEIAQSTCAHGGQVFARYWMHNGMVTVDGRKMSKSLNNTLLVNDVRARYDIEVLRYWLLGAHYRQPIDWSDSALANAKSTLDRMYGSLRDLADVEVEASSLDAAPEVLAALADDLNTPVALAELNALSKAANKAEGAQARTLAKQRLLGSAQFLGLLKQVPERWFQGEGQDGLADAEIDALIAERQSARESRDFAKADAVRKRLSDAGIVLEDTAAGVRWKRG